jgi:hypothetical protein
VKVDPLLKSLRQDPRNAELFTKMHFPIESPEPKNSESIEE